MKRSSSSCRSLRRQISSASLPQLDGIASNDERTTDREICLSKLLSNTSNWDDQDIRSFLFGFRRWFSRAQLMWSLSSLITNVDGKTSKKTINVLISMMEIWAAEYKVDFKKDSAFVPNQLIQFLSEYVPSLPTLLSTTNETNLSIDGKSSTPAGWNFEIQHDLNISNATIAELTAYLTKIDLELFKSIPVTEVSSRIGWSIGDTPSFDKWLQFTHSVSEWAYSQTVDEEGEIKLERMHDLVDIAWCCYEIGSFNMVFALLEPFNQFHNSESIISKSLDSECSLKWATLCRMFSPKDNFANYRSFMSRRLCMFPLPTLTIPVLILIGREIIFLKTGDVFDENSGKEQMNELRALYDRVAVPFLICQMNAQIPPI